MDKVDFLWKEFESKPVTRIAFELISEHDFEWDSETKTLSVTDGSACLTADCHQEPKYGDYIVKLAEDDFFYCPREVFVERYYLD